METEERRRPGLSSLARLDWRMSPLFADVLVGILVSVLMACAIELLAFNFRWLITRHLHEEQPVELSWTFDEDLQQWICALDANGYTLRSLRIEPSEGKLDVSLFLVDEGHALPNPTGSFSLNKDKPDTCYLIAVSYGTVSRIVLTCGAEDLPQPCTVTPNAHIPLCVLSQRISLLVVIIAMSWLVRPGSAFRKVPYHGSLWSLAGVWVVSSAMVVSFLMVNASDQRSYALDTGKLTHTNQQYADLARAFSQGHTYLSAEPKDELVQMENPYDCKLRYYEGVDVLWDSAYYDGHFYCYFGVLPCLMFHLPYYLITGHELPNDAATGMALVALIAGAIGVVHQMIRRWYAKASWGDYLAMFFSLLCCSWIMQLAFWADHIYYPPIALGLALVLGALALWMNATAGEEIGYVSATLGTLCAALTLACRPQLFIVCLFGLVLLLDKLRDARNRSPRIALIFIPLVVVFLLMMLYNHARFGNPFDVGADYNMTSNDMVHRGTSVKRMALSAYYYLLHPLAGSSEPPFLGNVVAGLPGLPLIAEEIPGGFIWATPIVMLIAAVPFRMKRRRGLELCMCITALFAALVLVLFDGEGAGVLARYFSDFGWLLGLVVADAWATLGAVMRMRSVRRGSGAIVVGRVMTLAAIALAFSWYVQLFWMLFVRLR